MLGNGDNRQRPNVVQRPDVDGRHKAGHDDLESASIIG
jgi:hypothetical protein